MKSALYHSLIGSPYNQYIIEKYVRTNRRQNQNQPQSLRRLSQKPYHRQIEIKTTSIWGEGKSLWKPVQGKTISKDRLQSLQLWPCPKKQHSRHDGKSINSKQSRRIGKRIGEQVKKNQSVVNPSWHADRNNENVLEKNKLS